MRLNLPVDVKGHIKIEDDQGTVLLDKDNAVYPQNLARVFARSLSNEHNFFVHRVAFGNDGTIVDGAFQITYRPPHDGFASGNYADRLYNETYTEVIDESNVLIGTNPEGGDAAGDPASVEHVSGPGVRSTELGLTSEVVISVVLNPNEPQGQFLTDAQGVVEDSESDFTFDEIGLYTSGLPDVPTAGIATVDVGNKLSTDDSGLLANTQYNFDVTIDGGGLQQIVFTTPVVGGTGPSNEILFGDIVEAVNTGDGTWLMSGSPEITGGTMSITDYTGNWSTLPLGTQTFGFLKVESTLSVGSTSTVLLATGTGAGIDMVGNFIPAGILEAPLDGVDAGIQNDPVDFATERERLLTHIIFSPILKSANRTLTVTYTLTISVAQTV